MCKSYQGLDGDPARGGAGNAQPGGVFKCEGLNTPKNVDKTLRSTAMQSVVITMVDVSLCLSVRLAVGHALVLYQNDASQDHDIVIDGQLQHSSFCQIRFIQKFERVHPKQRCLMRGVELRFSVLKWPQLRNRVRTKVAIMVITHHHHRLLRMKQHKHKVRKTYEVRHNNNYKVKV